MTKEQAKAEYRTKRVALRRETRRVFRPVSWNLWASGMALARAIQAEIMPILEARHAAESRLDAIGLPLEES